MAILVSDNFNYKARKPLDNRILQPDVATMAALKDATLYDGMICYVQDVDKFYVYNSDNSIDSATAKFRELTLDGDALAKPYAQDTDYKKDSLVYFDNKLAIVVADFKSDSTEAGAEDSFDKDVNDNKLILISGEVEQTIKPYTQGTQYYRNDLVFIGTSLARVVADYVSDDTAATVEDSFKSDIANNNLTLISGDTGEFSIYESIDNLNREINGMTYMNIFPAGEALIDGYKYVEDWLKVPSTMLLEDFKENDLIYSPDGTVGRITVVQTKKKRLEITTISISDPNHYMKQAPDKREYKITSQGSGYAVGDVIETTEICKFVEVTQVGVNGEIIEVIESADTTVNTNGSNGIIDTNKIYFVGSGNNWYQLPSVEFPRSEVYEYKQGTEYKTNDIIIYNDNVYLALKDFTSNNTEALVKDSFEKEITLHNLVAVYTDTDTHSFEYTLGEEYKESNLLVKDKKLYLVVNDFTATDFDTELKNGDIVSVQANEGTSLKEYVVDTDYKKDSLVYLNNRIARVVNDFTSTNDTGVTKAFETDIDNGDLILIGGSEGTSLLAYKQNTAYDKDSLVYLGSKVARVDKDFTSNTDTDINIAFQEDVTLKNLILLGGSGDAYLTKDIKATITVGNINANETMKENMTFTEFVEKLLVKEILPIGAINVSSNVSSTLVHKGDTVNITNIRANITALGTCTIDKVEFYKGSTLLDTKTYVDGTNIYDYALTESITTDTEYSIRIYYTGKNGNTGNLKYSTKYEFVNYSYFGSTTNTPTESDILTMTTSLKKIKGFTGIITSTNPVVDSHIVYAYPKNFGELTSIKDQNNFEYINSYTRATATLNGESYYIYYLTDSVTVSDFKQIYA